MTEAPALEALIAQHMVTSMKAREADRLGTLRMIKTALKNKQIEKRAQGKIQATGARAEGRVVSEAVKARLAG